MESKLLTALNLGRAEGRPIALATLLEGKGQWLIDEFSGGGASESTVLLARKAIAEDRLSSAREQVCFCRFTTRHFVW